MNYWNPNMPLINCYLLYEAGFVVSIEDGKIVNIEVGR